jgi:hypothetical protein
MLKDETNPAAKSVLVGTAPAGDRSGVCENLALGGSKKPCQKVEQRTFAGSVGPADQSGASGRKLDTDAVKDGLLLAVRSATVKRKTVTGEFHG